MGAQIPTPSVPSCRTHPLQHHNSSQPLTTRIILVFCLTTHTLTLSPQEQASVSHWRPEPSLSCSTGTLPSQQPGSGRALFFYHFVLWLLWLAPTRRLSVHLVNFILVFPFWIYIGLGRGRLVGEERKQLSLVCATES